MKSTHKIIIAGVLSCSTLGMTATAQTGVASFDQAAAAEVKTETVKMALTGLKWASGCPPKVQAALLKLDGVSKADVTKTSAEVTVDRDKVTDEQLIKAVEGAGTGYGATIDAGVESVSLVLTGLKWATGCPPKVQAALLKLDGVSKADVTKTSADIEVDRSKVTDEQIIEAVKGAGKGYGATIKEEAAAESVSLVLSGLKWASGCPPKVQAALLKLDGVSKADCTKTTADVTVDRSKFTDAQLMAAVKAAGSGYSATLAKKEK